MWVKCLKPSRTLASTLLSTTLPCPNSWRLFPWIKIRPLPVKGNYGAVVVDGAGRIASILTSGGGAIGSNDVTPYTSCLKERLSSFYKERRVWLRETNFMSSASERHSPMHSSRTPNPPRRGDERWTRLVSSSSFIYDFFSFLYYYARLSTVGWLSVETAALTG